MGKVQGTKPDYEDCIKIYIDLEDSEGKLIQRVKYDPKAELSVCRQDGTPTPIMIQANNLNNIHQITLVEIGKDAEYWGGHYGTVFSNERLYVHAKQSTQEKNLLKSFGNRGVQFDSISTFFNLGFGNNYYINGEQVSGLKWKNHAEYDASLILSSIGPQLAYSKHG